MRGIKSTLWKWCEICKKHYKSKNCNHKNMRKEPKPDKIETKKKTLTQDWDGFFE